MSQPAPQTAVTVVTGFLGSGKTTLIAGLLKDPRLTDTAVIINEFGEVGLDHILVEAIEGEVMLLQQGCVCCTLNGTLSATLEALDMRRLSGAIPPFRRVIVETTGLADPAPVLQSLLERAMLMRGYTPGRVVTTVDAVTGGNTLARHAEARRQVAVADQLLLTKTDLANSGSDLIAQIRTLNTHAPLATLLHGEIGMEALFGDPACTMSPPHRSAHRFAAEAVHTSHIVTATVRPPEPVAFNALAEWLGGLVGEHGANLLRVKGIVSVIGHRRPVVVHGVGHVFHPPRFLDTWPNQLVEPVIVFILDGIEASTIHRSAASAGITGDGESHDRPG